MRVRLTEIIACLALAAAAALPCAAASDLAAALRHEHRAHAQNLLAPGTLTAVMQSPGDYAGQYIEVTASMVGMVTAGTDRTMLLTIGPTSLAVAVPRTPTGADEIGTDGKVRALVAIVKPAAADAPCFRLVAVAPDYDVAQAERAEQAAVARRAALTSRSIAYTRDDSERIAGVRAAEGRDDVLGGDAPAGLSYGAQRIFPTYRKAVHDLNPRLSGGELDTITSSILRYSEMYEVDPRLVVAMIIAESGFDVNSTSRVGAMGLGQLMPGTANGLGVDDPYDPEQNIAGSVKLLRGNLDRYGGCPPLGAEVPASQLKLCMAAYNAGPGAVHKYHGVPPYRETQRYVAKVLAYYRRLCGHSS